MKVALQYSGHLRFIQETWPKIKDEFFTSNEEIEFYYIFHTWEESMPEDIEYMKNVIKPHRYYIDKQKDFEKHPYQLMNVDMKHEEYKIDKNRLNWNIQNPNDQKLFFEKPSPSNNFFFDKNLEVVRPYHYSHYPFNTLSLFYSMHQTSFLTNTYAQENNIEFDYVIRMRSDLQILSPINLDLCDKEKITVFDAGPHRGEQGFRYTTQDQFAVGNPKLMTIYNDIFIYLPCYYQVFKLDWVSEILVGFHLQYNKIQLTKLPRHFKLLRYPERIESRDRKVERPTR